MFLSSISRVSDGQGLRRDGQMHIFYEGCNRKPKTEFGLKNNGKHWQLEFVCPPIYESCGFWLVLQKYFFNQLIFWRGRYTQLIIFFWQIYPIPDPNLKCLAIPEPDIPES